MVLTSPLFSLSLPLYQRLLYLPFRLQTTPPLSSLFWFLYPFCYSPVGTNLCSSSQFSHCVWLATRASAHLHVFRFFFYILAHISSCTLANFCNVCRSRCSIPPRFAAKSPLSTTDLRAKHHSFLFEYCHTAFLFFDLFSRLRIQHLSLERQVKRERKTSRVYSYIALH